MQQRVTTAEGRRLAFAATPHEYGRVVYEVAKVGAFTIEPELRGRGGAVEHVLQGADPPGIRPR